MVEKLRSSDTKQLERAKSDWYESQKFHLQNFELGNWLIIDYYLYDD